MTEKVVQENKSKQTNHKAKSQTLSQVTKRLLNGNCVASTVFPTIVQQLLKRNKALTFLNFKANVFGNANQLGAAGANILTKIITDTYKTVFEMDLPNEQLKYHFEDLTEKQRQQTDVEVFTQYEYIFSLPKDKAYLYHEFTLQLKHGFVSHEGLTINIVQARAEKYGNHHAQSNNNNRKR